MDKSSRCNQQWFSNTQTSKGANHPMIQLLEVWDNKTVQFNYLILARENIHLSKTMSNIWENVKQRTRSWSVNITPKTSMATSRKLG
jgi:hypothetical protein